MSGSTAAGISSTSAAHTAIVEGIVAGDVGKAELWMAKHIRDFKRGYVVAGMNLDAPITMDLVSR